MTNTTNRYALALRSLGARDQAAGRKVAPGRTVARLAEAETAALYAGDTALECAMTILGQRGAVRHYWDGRIYGVAS